MALNPTSGSVRLFIDSANTEAWKKFLPTGVFYGVTTNTLLLRESNVACQIKSLTTLSKQALGLGAKEVHLQAWGKTPDALVRTGNQLANIDSSIVVQIPATYSGLKAASKLKDMGARIALIIYSMHQALLALGIGAEYISFNVGKVPSTDISEEESKQNLSSIQNMVRAATHATRLLIANVLSMEHLTALTATPHKTGASPCFTLHPPLIDQLLSDKLTEEMSTRFETAAVSTSGFNLFI